MNVLAAASLLFHCSFTHPGGHLLHFGLMAAVPLGFVIPLSRMKPRHTPDDDDARRARALMAMGMRRR